MQALYRAPSWPMYRILIASPLRKFRRITKEERARDCKPDLLQVVGDPEMRGQIFFSRT